MPKRWFWSGFASVSTSEHRASCWWRAPSLISICFVFAWHTRFRMRCNALWELKCKVGARWSFWLLAKKRANSGCSQMASFAASDGTMYAASIVESVVHSCSYDLLEMAQLWCWSQHMRAKEKKVVNPGSKHRASCQRKRRNKIACIDKIKMITIRFSDYNSLFSSTIIRLW